MIRCMEPETDWVAPKKVTVGGPEQDSFVEFMPTLYTIIINC